MSETKTKKIKQNKCTSDLWNLFDNEINNKQNK